MLKKIIDTIVTGIWSALNSEQQQKLIDTVKCMQSRETKPKASKHKNSATGNKVVNNINLNANATSSSTSKASAYAESKTISELAIKISNETSLTNAVKQEYQDLINEIEDKQDDKSYPSLISQLLTKLASDGILPIPAWILKALTKALKMFKS